MSAPERIWASGGSYPKFDDNDWTNGSANIEGFGREYVRADLYATQAARIAELEAALREAIVDLELYDLDVSGEGYNNPRFNKLLDAALSTTPSNAIKEKE